MAIFKSLNINSTGSLTLPSGTSGQRPLPTTSPTVVSFTSVGTTSWTVPANVTSVEVLVVAGGGGGGGDQGGGGGGGGGVVYNTAYTVTPGNSITVTVGAGGTGNGSRDGAASSGGNSVFGTITAYGGAGGPSMTVSSPYYKVGVSGGSGSGASVWQAPDTMVQGGSPVFGQGNKGGNAYFPNTTYSNGHVGGGGGGAGAPGGFASNQNGGHGGNGIPVSITGSIVYYGAGGGGGCYYSRGGNGGLGGGGKGLSNTGTAGSPGAPATDQHGAANTGSGGGGAGGTGGNGGSGVVIIKYLTNAEIQGTLRINSDTKQFETYQTPTGWTSLDPTYLYATGGDRVDYSYGFRTHYFTSSSGTFTPSVSGVVEVLVVGGGGAGSQDTAGGGGGGGVLYCPTYYVEAGKNYSVTVGSGAPRTTSAANQGNSGKGDDSTFGYLRAIGGGGGQGSTDSSNVAGWGGSGGGGGYSTPQGMNITGQGYPGEYSTGAAGGGGAGGTGSSGIGGIGVSNNITGFPLYYGGGGGGASGSNVFYGNLGGGGSNPSGEPFGASSYAGLPYTGGGAAGYSGSWGGNLGAGSGIVIVRYKFPSTSEEFYSGSGTWTVPAGVTEIQVKMWGGGGSAGQVVNIHSGSGGGGAGATFTITGLTPGTQYAYSVGAGGAVNNPGSNANGNAGGATTFMGVTCGGGGPGRNASAGSPAPDPAAGGSVSGTPSPGGSASYSNFVTESGQSSLYSSPAGTREGAAGLHYLGGGESGFKGDGTIKGFTAGRWPGGAANGSYGTSMASQPGGDGFLMISYLLL